ncbi:Ig-like domain-containing protein [Methanobrevibacter sp.]|uniref:Ig-like domain-containing protein n=1 Tax=Methanobrevibacter sp. TaxID=66852 RepID=UPI0038649DCD
MKFNKTILLFSIVFISLIAVGSVCASDNVSDVIEVAGDSDVVAVETDLNDDTAEILAENDVEDDVVSVADDAPLTENASSTVSEITIYSGDKQVSAFNFTNTDGTYDFADIIKMLNQSDLNMSNFGNFADMFNNFNFTGENKTFDFKIEGDLNEVNYKLGILSNPEKFVFDYFVKSPNMDAEFNNISTTDLSVFVDGKFLTNITFNANVLSMDELMKMFNMTSFDNMNIKDMMSQFDFSSIAAQFGNSTAMGESNKTFDFKIDGEVGNIKYDLVTKSNATSFVFDYTIRFKQLEVEIDAEGVKATAVNVVVDGENGKNLTITLKDQFGNAIINKLVHIALDNKVYDLETDADGKVNVQLNIAKAGKYVAAITILGDNTFAGEFKVVDITVNKQTPKLTVAKKTYKAKAKTKKLTATFKSAKGKAIKGKKITFKLKGKTYTAKTNAKGVATVKVKITKKGTHTFTAKFAGDSTYKAVSKSNKLIIK